VVENKAVAKECINYLRDQRVGTCVFLPLDNINPPPLSEKARSFGERYKPCLHLLKFDEQYKVRPIFVAPGYCSRSELLAHGGIMSRCESCVIHAEIRGASL
jgi:hypothetical protein